MTEVKGWYNLIYSEIHIAVFLPGKRAENMQVNSHSKTIWYLNLRFYMQLRKGLVHPTNGSEFYMHGGREERPREVCYFSLHVKNL